MSKEPSCDNCRFWGGDDDSTGPCRFNPPVVVLNDDGGLETVWPLTDDFEWCGKHEPKPEAEAS